MSNVGSHILFLLSDKELFFLPLQTMSHLRGSDCLQTVYTIHFTFTYCTGQPAFKSSYLTSEHLLDGNNHYMSVLAK